MLSIASGGFSSAYGNSSTASGDYSYASGLCAVASQCYSFSFGNRTTASGTYSVVFGCNNTDNGCNLAFIFGENISADRVKTTFVENLSIKSIPTSSAGLPSGAVYRLGTILNIVP